MGFAWHTRVTLDTNILPADQLISSALSRGFEMCVVSATWREIRGTSFIPGSPIEEILEDLVWDESEWDNCILGDADSNDRLESILRIMTEGAFPHSSNRREMTKGQRNTLRDAMIFSAHVRDGRDIFVTNDAKGFIKHGRKERLEQLYSTQILTKVEFANLLEKFPHSHSNRR